LSTGRIFFNQEEVIAKTGIMDPRLGKIRFERKLLAKRRKGDA